MLIALLLITSVSEAGRRNRDVAPASKCDVLKPEQRLSDDQQKKVEAAMKGGFVGFGSVSASGSVDQAGSTTFQTLSQDALAKAWFIYQTCVLQEAGMLDPATAQSIIKKHMGMTALPAAQAAPPPETTKPEKLDFVARMKKIDEETKKASAEAAEAFAMVSKMAQSEGGERHLKAFISHYESLTVDVGGSPEPISVPQVKEAKVLLRKLTNPEPPPADDPESKCEGGDGAACKYLAVSYDLGDGVEADATKANAYYTKGCDLGNGPSCTFLGYNTFFGNGVAADRKAGVQLYIKGCDLGHAYGCDQAGDAWFRGNEVDRDYAKAAAAWKVGCDGEQGNSCNALGEAYEYGEGVDKNLGKAASLYERACTSDFPEGCYNLGFAKAQRHRHRQRPDRRGFGLRQGPASWAATPPAPPSAPSTSWAWA